MTCSVQGCDRRVHARGMCGSHYMKARGAGFDESVRDLAQCGVDTPFGCKQSVHGVGHIVLGIAPPHQGHNGMGEFHPGRCCPCPSCLNLIAVVPNAFSRGLAREQAARMARAAS